VGFAFSVFAEPYLNFGWLGVVVFAALFGAGWRLVYGWYAAHKHNVTVFTVFAMSWPFMIVYMRGGFGVDYHRQVIYIFPIVLASFLATRKVKRPLSRGTWPTDAAGSGKPS
jgi:O-antigen ligase